MVRVTIYTSIYTLSRRNSPKQTQPSCPTLVLPKVDIPARTKSLTPPGELPILVNDVGHAKELQGWPREPSSQDVVRIRSTNAKY